MREPTARRSHPGEPRRIVEQTHDRCQKVLTEHGAMLSAKEKAMLEIVTRAYRLEITVTLAQLNDAMGVLGGFSATSTRRGARDLRNRRL